MECRWGGGEADYHSAVAGGGFEELVGDGGEFFGFFGREGEDAGPDGGFLFVGFVGEFGHYAE